MSTAFPKSMTESNGEIKFQRLVEPGGFEPVGTIYCRLLCQCLPISPPKACRYECNVTAIFSFGFL